MQGGGMRRQVQRMGTAALLVSLAVATGVSAQVPAGLSDDPVVIARATRPSPGDLPPVPRTIVEPPPLPPPELHPRDRKGSRSARAAKRASRKGGKAAAKKAPKRAAAPSKKKKGR